MSRQKTILMIILALSLSGFGVLFAYHYIQSQVAAQRDQTAHMINQPQAQANTIELVGLPRQLTQGTRIEENMIRAMTVNLDIALTGDYVTWEEKDLILGQKLIVTLPATAALRFSDLVDATYALFSDRLNPGERAMTIPADAFSTLYGYLQPNDYIDILLMAKDHKLTTSIPLLNKIEILATDTIIEPNLIQAGLPNSGKINTITLRVSADQAKKLALAQTKGELIVLLRNSQDSLPASEERFSERHFFPQNKPVKPVEIILGGAS